MRPLIRQLLIAGTLLWGAQTSAWAAIRTWNQPFFGAFNQPTSWFEGFVPTSGDEARFLFPTNYAVAFTQSLQSSNSVLVQDGDVIFVWTVPMGLYEVGTDVVIGGGGLPTSLELQAGTLSAGSINVLSGSILTGDGGITSNNINVHAGGELRGTLHLGGTVLNHGRIAPGNSPGIIVVDGNFIQESDGVLEIEIGGTSPGTQHDQLQVSGSAFLAGRLEVPFINGYQPTVGDTIQFISSPNLVELQLRSFAFPNLNSSSVAVRVFPSPIGAAIGFVTPNQVSFNQLAPPPPNSWDSPTTWGAPPPNSASIVNAVNQGGISRRIDLTSETNRFVHEIHLSGNTQTMTLHVPSEANLTAIHQIEIGANGILEIEQGGTVNTNRVNLNGGGKLKGSGTINGDLIVGTNPSSQQSVISPGFSPGTLQVSGDLTLGDQALLEIEIDSASSFDKVVVSQIAELGGEVEIDITGVNIASIKNIPFTVLTADNVEERFDTIETVGNPEYFFAASYSDDQVDVTLYDIGDMDRDGALEPIDDPVAFAMAVRFPTQYYNAYGVRNFVSGNIDGMNGFDFDDFDDFAGIQGLNISLTALMEIIGNYQLVPEPHSWLLALISCATLGSSCRINSRRKRQPYR